MSKERQHTKSIHKNDFFDKSKGAYAALGGPLYIKKILGKATYLIQASDSFYHEITPACFKATVERSTIIDTATVKKRLEAFNEQ
tara:strand:+ start:137 stop:391 length:255 start_codon:yes stop_codon:yes gene_type:complete